MLDEDSLSYALVDQQAQNATSMADVIDLLGSLESDIYSLFASCGDVTSAGAAWAAVSSTASRAARARIEELGGDVDSVRGSLDRFFLINPDA